ESEQYQHAACDIDDLVALYAGQLDQTDILCIGRVGTGVEQPAKNDGYAVCAVSSLQVAAVHITPGNITECKVHASRFYQSDRNDKHHGQNRHQREFRCAEVEYLRQMEPGSFSDCTEVDESHKRCTDCPDDNP